MRVLLRPGPPIIGANTIAVLWAVRLLGNTLQAVRTGDLTRATGLRTKTVHNSLRTLVRCGLVRSLGEGESAGPWEAYVHVQGQPWPVVDYNHRCPPEGEIRLNEDGTLDEVVAADCFVHLEQMDEGLWWMRIALPDGSAIVVNLYSKRLSTTKVLARAERE